jgi:hypothetical protein
MHLFVLCPVGMKWENVICEGESDTGDKGSYNMKVLRLDIWASGRKRTAAVKTVAPLNITSMLVSV